MGRWAKYGQGDTPWVTDGDAGWKGIDMIHDRSTLPPGYLSRCENKRLREGPAATRKALGFPPDFNPVFENRIIGSAIFTDPNGEEVMLVATLNATYIWVLQYNKDPIKVDLVAGENTGTNATFSLVQFVQAFDKVIMLRFPFDTPLVWDGDPAHDFELITLISPGLKLIPFFEVFGVPYKNRIIYYTPYVPATPYRDQVIISDVNNYSSYDEVYADIRINSGESDFITCVLPFFFL